MSEDDIRNHLNRQSREAKPQALVPTKVAPRRPRPARPPAAGASGYKDFSATHLFCPRCRQAMPVREKILLFLPDGDLFDYSCTQCGTSLGTRKAGRD